MITDMFIKNFKSFKDIHIKLGSLTVLTGLNSSGKSSIIQVLRMLDKYKQTKDPILPNHGKWQELKSNYSNDSITAIELTHESSKCIKLSFNHNDEAYQDDNLCYLPSSFYLSADRLGPRPNLPLNNNDEGSIGEHGEYVIDFLYKNSQNPVADIFKDYVKAEGVTLEYCVEKWLEIITPGVSLKTNIDNKHDVSTSEFNGHRATNVGFGLSYTLPVIIALIGLKSTGVDSFYVENPEAHLHPKGQTMLGKLIAIAAFAGLQIIVETHSDHLVDGIRIAIREELLPATDCNIYFLKNIKDHQSDITPITVDCNGKVNEWPDGFFDQALINKAILSRRD